MAKRFRLSAAVVLTAALVAVVPGHAQQAGAGAPAAQTPAPPTGPDGQPLFRTGINFVRVDVIVSEYVLEHIDDVAAFVRETDRVLKPGGYFFARTPHKYHYVSMAARWVRNAHHVAFLSRAQPHRKAEDVFPTTYRLNTMADIRKHFGSYEDFSYLYASEPTYFFGSRLGYRLFSILHAMIPDVFVSNIYVVVRKPATREQPRFGASVR